MPSEAKPSTRLPVTFLSGFLGEGKSTLLNRVARNQAGENSANRLLKKSVINSALLPAARTSGMPAVPGSDV